MYENIINYTVASIDVALPAMFVLVWICFTLMYAGFPYRSSQAAYATVRLTKVTACWCAGRLVLGYFQFSSTLNPDYGKDLPANDHSMVILSVLVVCDILPICLSLTGSVGILLDGADEEGKSQRNRKNGGGNGGNGNYLLSETSDDMEEEDDKSNFGGSGGGGSGGGGSGGGGHDHNRNRSADDGGGERGASGDMRRILSVPWNNVEYAMVHWNVEYVYR